MIQVKRYANKAGKAEGKKNRVQIVMADSEAQALADKDKDMLTDLIKAVKAAMAEDGEV